MPTNNSWNSPVPVTVPLGGTGVTSLSSGNIVVGAGTSAVTSIAYSATGGTSNIVSRDSSGNSAANNFTSGSTNVTSAGSTTVLTAASTRLQVLQGTQVQTFQLPNATTLSIGARFEFNNNSTQTLTVVDAASGGVCTVPSGGYGTVIAIAVSTSAGAWDKHFQIPSNGSYGTAGLSITGDLAVSGLTGVLTGNGSSNISANAVTQHGILIAGASNAVSSVTGSTGAVLISTTGSDPSFSATPTVTSITISNSPSAATDGTNKSYVDAIAAGLDFKNSVVAASTGALTVTYSNGAAGIAATLTNAGAQAAFALDGQSPTSGQRVLIKDQASAFQNGIYTVTTVGDGSTNWVLTRATDYNTPAQIQPGDLIPVEFGTVNATTVWLQTATVTTIGSDSISFTQFVSKAVAYPLIVANGGTGLATLTAHNLMVGEGTGNVAFVAPSATSGVPLISQGASSDPAYGTAVVAGGGTGLTAVTAHYLPIGNGTSALTLLAPGSTSGVPLISQGASSDPAYGTAVVAGGGTGLTAVTAHYLPIGNGTSALTLLAPSATSGTALISQGASSDPAYGTVVVSSGGTGAASFTAYSVICAGTTSTGAFQNVSGVGTSGQILTSNGASALPTWQAAPAGGFTYVVSTTSQSAAVGTSYLDTDTSGTDTYTLPATAAVGDRVQVVRTGVGAVVMTANTGQTIRFGSTATSSAGSLTSQAQGDSVSVTCYVANTSWIVTDSQGNWTAS